MCKEYYSWMAADWMDLSDQRGVSILQVILAEQLVDSSLDIDDDFKAQVTAI